MFEKIKTFVISNKYAVMFVSAVVVGLVVYMRKNKK